MEASDWVAHATLLAISIEEEGSPRPVSLLVIEIGFIIHQNLLGRLGGDPEVVAEVLAHWVREAAGSLRRFPPRVIVRHADVATALDVRLAVDEVDVGADPSPPGLEEAGRALLFAFGELDVWPPIARSETWHCWGSHALTKSCFEAATRYYEAAPWRSIANQQARRAKMPSGREWTVAVLGAW